MASNSFGNIFKITTFGESHGPVIGVVVDGCPAGIEISVEEINDFLSLRKPSGSQYVSSRQEADQAEILSGIFMGKTTGAPIALMIKNNDIDSTKYETIKDLYRPGHANFAYLKKYGIFDYRGGGRASARETVARVAAGTIALKLLAKWGIATAAYLKSIGSIQAAVTIDDINQLRQQTYASQIFCPDAKATGSMIQELVAVKKNGDSIGGVVEFIAIGLPTGLGDPIYNKLDAQLASAMLSIPASKGFEIGDGFEVAKMRGSECNDEFAEINGKTITKTNHAGGVLAGISTGMPLIGRVAFKPTPSISLPQNTVDINGKSQIFQLPTGSRHDPCVAIRAVPVIEAMCALVIADAWLSNSKTQL